MNTLTLAVAGGRKTQSIVDCCVHAAPSQRILVLTYTQANQRELVARLAGQRPIRSSVDVQGWLSFLLSHWVRPYLPTRFAGQRLRGLNFEGDPGMYATGQARFLDQDGRAYKRHLAHLSVDVNIASSTAVLDRLGRIYDEIYIDEVQDLNGYDLEVVDCLLGSNIEVHLVGDIRQALLMTNVQDPKNKQYKGVKIGKWFDSQESRGRLEISYQSTTWRSNQTIATLADSIFPASRGFPTTRSENTTKTGHDGVFAVANRDADSYMARFNPLCLRYNASCAKSLAHLPFINIGVAKGMGVDRVLIGPTQSVLKFLRKSTPLGDTPSCSFYVAVTRARASVAIVADDPGDLRFPIWTP
jgi:DNA helicase-2/ATP-dependent DNA helicase PcrA